MTERRNIPLDLGGGTPIKGGRRSVQNNPRNREDRKSYWLIQNQNTKSKRNKQLHIARKDEHWPICGAWLDVCSKPVSANKHMLESIVTCKTCLRIHNGTISKQNSLNASKKEIF